MKIAIASDHGGFELKEQLVARLRTEYEVEDLGTHGSGSVDYPAYGRMVGEAVAHGRADRGIVICGTGIGIALAANKVPGIRASVCHDTFSAHVGVEHNDLNVLALGGRVIGIELAHELARAFLNARFSGDARHVRRLGQIVEIERECSLASDVAAGIGPASGASRKAT